ncbi:restriction endonuclease subunit S [Caldibacillus thermoamylovorans]|nr:restriction endonuclease subunit S [Caldibacillus thermoamylovorans]
MKYKIHELCEINKNTLSKNDNYQFINYLETSNLTEGTISDLQRLDVNVDRIPSRAKRIVKEHDILISTVRPNQKHYGIIHKPIENMIASTGFAVITPDKSKVYPEYLYRFLIQDQITQYLQAVAETSTSTYPSIKPSVIGKLEIELPTIKEQIAVANILASLDQKIGINNEINKKLEEMAQAIFKHWFVDFEFPNENGEPYKSSGGEMVESELGMIPKGWKIGSINDLGTIVSGGTPSKKKEEYYTEHGIPWITPKDLSLNKNRFISRGTIDITEEGLKNSSAKLMPKGTVLFSSRAPIGYIAIAKNEVSTNQGFKSIIPKNNIGSEFVYQFLKMNKEIIESRASGSTFKEISGGELKKIPAIIPSNNIIYRYNLITIKISSFIKNNEEELEKLRTIRDTLLPKLMSGEIRVPVEE